MPDKEQVKSSVREFVERSKGAFGFSSRRFLAPFPGVA